MNSQTQWRCFFGPYAFPDVWWFQERRPPADAEISDIVRRRKTGSCFSHAVNLTLSADCQRCRHVTRAFDTHNIIFSRIADHSERKIKINAACVTQSSEQNTFWQWPNDISRFKTVVYLRAEVTRSQTSASEGFTTMRYINLRFTYLLTYSDAQVKLRVSDTNCFVEIMSVDVIITKLRTLNNQDVIVRLLRYVQ